MCGEAVTNSYLGNFLSFKVFDESAYSDVSPLLQNVQNHRAGFLNAALHEVWAASFFVVGAVLCVVACLASQTSAHEMPVAPPQPPSVTECLQTLPSGPRGLQNCPYLRAAAFGGN